MEMINATINGQAVSVPPGTSILDAARSVYIRIPALCYHPDLKPTAACGICVVKIEGMNKTLRACCTPIEEGMSVITDDPELVEVRGETLQLMLSKHPNACLTCGRNTACELQSMTAAFGVRESCHFDVTPKDVPVDTSTGVLALDPAKCITCGRCVQVCQEVQDVHALCFLDRGIETTIAAAGVSLADSPCVACGQCAAHCPTGAIVEFDETDKVWRALKDPEIHTVAQIAPAVRVAIGEAFGYPIGENLTGKLYAALRRLGFDTVFDTNFGADLTIVEEANEFVNRFGKGEGELPLLTSCCPAWVDFMEKFHHDAIDLFSTAKSPHEMLGAMTKTYYAQKHGIDPAKIQMISVMPCTAKKWEIHRSQEMSASGYQDVDVCLTTREIARMIKQAGVAFRDLPDEQCDLLLGEYSGAGTIFGATGGVMEAALRTAQDLVTGEDMGAIDFEQVRGLEGIKEAEIEVAGKTVRVAVAHGLANVSEVVNKVKAAKAAGEEPPYHFVEVMACPGGCVGGGGQPYGVTDELRRKRAAGLYGEDKSMKLRKSHDNPMIKALYDEFLGEPCGEKSHELLHTHYQAREMYAE